MLEYGLTVSSAIKNAQPPARAEEGRGDSSQDQSHVTRPAQQAQSRAVFAKLLDILSFAPRLFPLSVYFTLAVHCMLGF